MIRLCLRPFFRRDSCYNSETQDILHRLELHDDSYHDMARLSKTLKEARQDRRAAKDAISELDPICGWARENARVLKSLEQLLGNVRKAEKATQNRYYSDRTDAVKRSIRHEKE